MFSVEHKAAIPVLVKENKPEGQGGVMGHFQLQLPIKPIHDTFELLLEAKMKA